MSSDRNINPDWHRNQPWRDAADNADILFLSGEPWNWGTALINLAWNFRDVGLAAAVVKRESEWNYRQGYRDGCTDTVEAEQDAESAQPARRVFWDRSAMVYRCAGCGWEVPVGTYKCGCGKP